MSRFDEKAANEYRKRLSYMERDGLCFMDGARWQHSQDAARIAELEKLHSLEAEAHHKTAHLYRQALLSVEELEAEVKRLEAEHKPVIKADGGTYTISATITTAKESQLAKKLRVAVECLHEYAAGNGNRIKPEKEHLYDKDYPMGSEKWRQRSMSDYCAMKLARQALEKIRGEG